MDLPGTADTNRARAGIADAYLEKCDFIWVAAPIERAVNDRAARDLMGNAFRMQLYLDDGYDDRSISFIATMTDRIQCTEVIRTLRLEGHPVWKELTQKTNQCKRQIEALKLERKKALAIRDTGYNAGVSNMPSRKRGSDVLANELVVSKKARGIIGAVKQGSSQPFPTQPDDPLMQQAEQTLLRVGSRLREQEEYLAILSQQRRAFCSRRRSEYACKAIKQDFRSGMEYFEAAAAEAANPDSYNPQAPHKDYAAIDLPVFPCSAIDYMQIKGQIVLDGETACFIDPDSTGIPAIQEWCHHVAHLRLEKISRGLLEKLKTLATEISSYAEGIKLDDVVKADCEAMREQWQTRPVQRDGQGIASRLKKALQTVAQITREQLQEQLLASLEERCHMAAIKAAESAAKVCDEFAENMAWQTYRATLRRHGTWRRDLNVELTMPFMYRIATFWTSTFKDGISMSFKDSAAHIIQTVLGEVKMSASLLLKERALAQADHSWTAANAFLDDTMDIVQDAIHNEQRAASRCLAPYIALLLDDGYEDAMKETGPGSVARQKRIFHDHVMSIKDTAFDDGARVLLERLGKLTETVEKTLRGSLYTLSEKMEVMMGVLWESPDSDDPLELKACIHVLATMEEIQAQINMWQLAAPSLN